jgi:hypothetical protein
MPNARDNPRMRPMSFFSFELVCSLSNTDS